MNRMLRGARLGSNTLGCFGAQEIEPRTTNEAGSVDTLTTWKAK